MKADAAAGTTRYRRSGPPPDEALRRLLSIKNKLGITRIADLTGLDIAGVPVAQAVRPRSRSNAVSQGKGSSLTEAAISAILESAESFFAERTGHFDITIGAARDLGVKPDLYAGHLAGPADSSWAGTEIAWAAASELFSGTPALVPFELVHTAYVLPPLAHDGVFQSSTTGLAVAFSEADAIAHGIFECIERDAIARAGTRHGFLQRSRIDVSSIPDGQARSLIAALEAKSFRIGLWHAPSPTGIPVVWCHLMEDTTPEATMLPHPAEGSAAAYEPSVAILHAVQEAAQSRLTAIAGARDDFSRRQYPRYPDWPRIAAHRDLLRRGPCEVEFNKLGGGANGSPVAGVPGLLERLERSGIKQAYLVRLNTAPFGELNAVKVIIPELLPLSEG